MLSRRSRYALRALIHLAQREAEGPASIAEIARLASAPRKFLEAILLDLKNHNLLVSSRGRAGGYQLAASAEAISFADVIRALDGPLALAPCASKTAYRPCE
ncbi:MAG: Rrf2 family transcriptional regulator, partial [Brevundimonas sp.]|nr:Rrf2 family transcriptional regulator [Brevundimonas sp.]